MTNVYEGAGDPPRKPTTTSRSQLYDEIWAEPVRTVAVRYHISDVALAKLCRRQHIPLPPRGYWAKVRAGQRSKRPPLPRLPAGASDQITIQGNHKPRSAVSDHTTQMSDAEKANGAKVEVADQLTDPHPHVAKAAKSLRAGRTDLQGTVIPRTRERLDIRVSPASVDRALRVMDATCKALEARGYAVEVDHEGKHGTSAIVLEERVFFFLDEKTTRVDHEPTPAERLDAKRWSWHTPPKYDYLLSGTLRLRIVDSDYLSIRTVWADGARQRIEDCLNDFITGLLKAAEAMKRRRVELAEAAKRRRAEEIRQADLERIRRFEEARNREVERQSDACEKAGRIRRYIERARETGRVYLPTDLKVGSLQEWLDLATRYANAVDPCYAKEQA